MRAVLVEWLVDVSQAYNLLSETLFLAINYIDRFLSREIVLRRELQLVGITCMLIAAKYEEVRAPQIDDFCYITDNTYTHDEMLAMEQQVRHATPLCLTDICGIAAHCSSLVLITTAREALASSCLLRIMYFD